MEQLQQEFLILLMHKTFFEKKNTNSNRIFIRWLIFDRLENAQCYRVRVRFLLIANILFLELQIELRGSKMPV